MSTINLSRILPAYFFILSLWAFVYSGLRSKKFSCKFKGSSFVQFFTLFFIPLFKLAFILAFIISLTGDNASTPSFLINLLSRTLDMTYEFNSIPILYLYSLFYFSKSEVSTTTISFSTTGFLILCRNSICFFKSSSFCFAVFIYELKNKATRASSPDKGDNSED